MRLQKFLAICGIASRRKAEEIIKSGRVSLNGNTVTEMGIIVDENRDEVLLDGVRIFPEEQKRYIILNKPRGYVTTACDQFDRKTVMDLVKEIPERIYPVGRLDYDTEGLLIMTNDGDFANSIAHPKHQIDKIYIAKVVGAFDLIKANTLRKGVEIDGQKTSPAKIKILKETPSYCEVRVIIHEGRNRQVRKMFEAVGCHVLDLKRICVGKFSLGSLPVGSWREFNPDELSYAGKYKEETGGSTNV